MSVLAFKFQHSKLKCWARVLQPKTAVISKIVPRDIRLCKRKFVWTMQIRIWYVWIYLKVIKAEHLNQHTIYNKIEKWALFRLKNNTTNYKEQKIFVTNNIDESVYFIHDAVKQLYILNNILWKIKWSESTTKTHKVDYESIEILSTTTPCSDIRFICLPSDNIELNWTIIDTEHHHIRLRSK